MMTKKKDTARKSNPPTVRIKPGTYQPTKAEKEKEYVFEGKPEEIVKRMFQPVKIVRDSDA